MIATIATACAGPLESVVSETIEISRVPSEFPVGFSLLTTPERQYVAYF
jgi:hypothetical protein